MENKKGTTTLSLVCKDSVVAAAEHRATMNTMIAHKVAKKIYKIDEHMLLTTAGLVGDAQVLARYARQGSRVYRTDFDGAVRLISNGETLRVRPTLSRNTGE